MNPSDAVALDLLRDVVTQFTDVASEAVVPEAELLALDIDSLGLAEMLFELEDRLGVPIAEPGDRPQRVSEVLALMAPHMAAYIALQATARPSSARRAAA